MARKRQGSDKVISEMYARLADEYGFCTEETLGNAWAGYLLAHPEERDIRAQARADIRTWYERHQHAAGQLALPGFAYDPSAVEKDGKGNIWLMSRLTLDAFLAVNRKYRKNNEAQNAAYNLRQDYAEPRMEVWVHHPEMTLDQIEREFFGYKDQGDQGATS